MKKLLSVFLLMCLLVTAIPCQAEATLAGHAQLIFDTVRWNVNFPKDAMVLHAEEYLLKMNKHVTLHTLLMEVYVSEDMDNMYGRASHLLIIDLDDGTVIDYKNFNGDIMWPDGDVTSKEDARHLLFNSYISYLEGWNEGVMDVEHEFITPLSEEDSVAINRELTALFIKPME